MLRLLAMAVLLLLVGRARADDLVGEASRVETGVEERIGTLLVHVLGNADTILLTADVTALDDLDHARDHMGLSRTGLPDDARYLVAGLAPTRDARRAALDDVLDASPDPVVRRLAEHARDEADDAARADRLLADDRHNRRASLLNDAVRPLGVFSGTAFLAVLNPFLLAGSAIDSVATTAINLWHYNRLSSPEREALVRYGSQLEREPRTAEAPEIARAIRRLGEKRAAALCTETVDLGERALDKSDLDHARFYLDHARDLDGCVDDTEKPLRRLDGALAARKAREDAGRWPVDDPPWPRAGEETRDYEALAVATALGSQGGMMEAASRYLARHDDSAFAPSARYVVALARDLGGHRTEARTELAKVADDDSCVGRQARALLATDEWTRLGAIADAERRHGRARVRYVLLGGGPDGRTAIYTAAHLGSEGLNAAQSFGIFNVIGIATRAWKAWRQDPISNQEIIDRGEEFLAREPSSPDAATAHERLALAYERAGNYGRALMHYRVVADPDPKRIAKLEGKLAERLLADSERDGNDPVRLEAIVNHLGETDAAETARKRLRDRPAAGETVVSREVLEALPSLAGPAGLDLDPVLLDGDPDNGELADAGVILAPGELRLTLLDPKGKDDRVERRSLSDDAYARAHAAAEDALYMRLVTAEHRDEDTGRYERYVPFYLQGELGEDGSVSVAPGVKLRRYRSDDQDLYQ
jgi:hypothetical protein